MVEYLSSLLPTASTKVSATCSTASSIYLPVLVVLFPPTCIIVHLTLYKLLFIEEILKEAWGCCICVV
ncbi:hypothetical protein M405DRAFT_265055 [Rhizopogon salebrosus TDB-379]|nr:hypothetical protein M405DRAFT_265055 [Rhizopogon salebrosus TDB-379]